MKSALSPRNPILNLSKLYICDIQEAFRNRILNMPSVISTAKHLILAARVFNSNIIVTEQAPSKLGGTVPELNLNKYDPPIMKTDKTRFSMISSSDKPRETSAVICGIETHVCVLQTCLDLLELENKVYIIVDGVSSQRSLDHEIALKRMSKAGAILTTFESFLFECVEDAQNSNFKQISQIVKQRNAELLNPRD